MAAANAVQNRDEIPYSAVLMVDTIGLARPGNPFGNNGEFEPVQSILPLVSLADPTGNSIGTASNPLVTTATLVANGISITVGDVSLAPGSNTVGNVGIVGSYNFNPAASATGSPVPLNGSYTAFNSGGNLVGVSSVNPLPVSLGNASIGGNPAASTIGQPIGSYAGLTGFSNSLGYTTVVSGTSPLPVYSDALATTVPLTLINNQIAPLNLNLGGELRVTANIATPVVVSGLPAVSLSNSANAIGSVVVTSLPAGSNTVTVSNFPATQVVSNAANFQVYVENFPATSNVSVTNFPTTSNVTLTSNSVSVSFLPNVTVNGLKFDSSGDLLVNAGVISGGGNPAAGAIGSNAPADGDYIAYANSTGQLIGVSTSNPLPVTGTFAANVSLGPGSNTIGNVGIIGTANVSVSNFPTNSNVTLTSNSVSVSSIPAITGNVGVIGNATVQGSVSVSNFPASQVVSNAANFQVFVENFPTSLGANVVTLGPGSNTIGNVGIIGNITVSNAANFDVFVQNFPATSNVTLTSNSVSVSSIPPVTGNVGVIGQIAVSNAANFQVYVENFPTTSNVSIVGNTTVNGLKFDANSALIVNAGVISGGVSGYAQGSNTIGQIGPLIQGAVRSDTETLTNATTSPLQLDQYGNLKTRDFSTNLVGGTTPEFATAFGFLNGSSTFEVVGPSNPLPVSDLSVGQVNLTSIPEYASQIGFTNEYTGQYVGVDNAFNPLPTATMANATANAPSFVGAPTSIQMLSMDLAGNLRVVTTGNGTVRQSNAALLQATVANAANFQVSVTNFPASSGGGNAAASNTGASVPSAASYTAYANATGYLTGVSASNPFPITGNVYVVNNSYTETTFAAVATANSANLYAATSNAQVLTLQATNVTSGAVSLTTYYYQNSSSTSFALVSGLVIPSNSSVNLISGPIALKSGDDLKILATVTNSITVIGTVALVP